MPGNLLIIVENGRGVITYGVKHSIVYNMKYAFLSIVIFISCSVCASGDLEIYPGINLEDQQRNYERPDESFAPLYFDHQLQHKKNWPELEEKYFGNGQSYPEFRARISERFRAIQDLFQRRRKELKERVENSYRNLIVPDFPDRQDDEFRKFSSKNRDFDQFKYPNQQILDDVRPYPQDSDSDFSFPDEEDMLNDNGGQERNPEGIFDVGGETSVKSTEYKDKSLDDPTQFAYAPPDPRFYEDTTNSDTMIQREAYGFNDGDEDVHANSEGLENQTGSVTSGEEVRDNEDTRQRLDNAVKMVALRPNAEGSDTAGVYIIAVVAGISAAATVGLIAFGIGWYNLQKHVKSASDVEYPAYGITGPNKEVSPSGDRRLAQSAQMYHYQHQKQQIIAMERAAGNDRHGSVSEADSDEENEEGDYTVYECPGLAPTGEMEVKNPLFQDDPTPAQTPAVKPNEEDVPKK